MDFYKTNSARVEYMYLISPILWFIMDKIIVTGNKYIMLANSPEPIQSAIIWNYIWLEEEEAGDSSGRGVLPAGRLFAPQLHYLVSITSR